MGLNVTYFHLPTCGGVGFIPSLSKGGEAPKAIYLALVEKVQVPRDDHVGHAC
jgi:hypothetical protein